MMIWKRFLLYPTVGDGGGLLDRQGDSEAVVPGSLDHVVVVEVPEIVDVGRGVEGALRATAHRGRGPLSTKKS